MDSPQTTIIIPTLEMAPLEVTDYLMYQLNYKTKSIDRIIIINNARDNTFSERYKSFKKIQVISDQPNLFVNRAWNYAMTLVKTKYFCLLNDDIMIHGILLDAISKLLDLKEEINITTVKTKIVYHFPLARNELRKTFQLKLDYRLLKYPDEIKQGWFMFGRTKNWIPIDVGYTGEIMYGDDWILKKNQEIGYYGTCLITNNLCCHFESSTVHATTRRAGEVAARSKPLS